MQKVHAIFSQQLHQAIAKILMVGNRFPRGVEIDYISISSQVRQGHIIPCWRFWLTGKLGEKTLYIISYAEATTLWQIAKGKGAGVFEGMGADATSIERAVATVARDFFNTERKLEKC